MSWAEVKRINSDFMNEPLNFHNYISDISSFGAESYVFDAQNESVFRELMSYSLLVYGHKAIHNTIYERLTDADVDYIIQKHNRLGQAWNSFYRVPFFDKGNIETVLKTLTLVGYNSLDIKFQQGIHRYIESKVSLSEGVGVWIDTVFGLNNLQLQMKNTLAEIMSDDNLVAKLVTNESILLILAFNSAVMSIDMTNDTFARLIQIIVQSTHATLDLVTALNNEGKLAELFENQTAMSLVVNNKSSMQAVVQNSTAFQIFLDSSIGMSVASTSSVAREVIVTAMTDALTANQAYEASKNAVDLLSQSHIDLVGGSVATDLISDTQEQIAKVVEVLTEVLSKSNVLFTNTQRLLDHTESMKAMIKTKQFIKLIFANEITKVAFLKVIETDDELKQIFLSSLDTSGFYTKSKLQSKTWTPVNKNDEYVVDETVTASNSEVMRINRLYVYDPVKEDNGATGSYRLYPDYVLRSSGSIKGYKNTETEIALNHVCHSFRYTSTVSGLIPTDCLQQIEYYKYTLN